MIATRAKRSIFDLTELASAFGSFAGGFAVGTVWVAVFADNVDLLITVAIAPIALSILFFRARD